MGWRLGFGLVVLSLLGCDSEPELLDAGPPIDAGEDAGTADTDGGVDGGMDGGAPDAGEPDGGAADAGGTDGGLDAGSTDAGTLDSGGADAGGVDAGGVDAGFDAGPPSVDAGPPGTPVRFECHPVVIPQLSGGISVSDNFWSGFRFQVTGGAVTTVGMGLHVSGTSPVFGALVALTGPTDWPDSANLTTPDVLGTTVIAFPGFPAGSASGPITASLPAGWYMAIFGKGAFGASGGSANTRSNSPSTTCTNGQNPVTIRQSDGRQILQGASPNFFVDAIR